MLMRKKSLGILAGAVLGAVWAAACVDGSTAWAQPGAPAGIEGPIVSLDFKGGSLQQFVQALRGLSGDTANIIVADDAAQARIPAMTLKGVETGAALQAVAGLFPNAADALTVNRIRPTNEGGTPIFVVSRLPSVAFPGGPTTSSPRRILRVASIKELVQPPAGETESAPAVRVEQILSAIDTAMALREEDGPPLDMKFHADTALLVYEGNVEQIEGVEDVLRKVRDDVLRQRSEWNDATERSAARRYRREEAEIQASLAEQKLARAHELLQDAEKRAEGGFASAAEVGEFRQRMIEAEAEMRLAEARHRSLGDEPRADEQVVIYDIRDFGVFVDEIGALLQRVAEGSATPAERGVLALRSRPAGHETVQRLLATLRRVKANDPRLEPAPTWKSPEDGPR